MGIRAEVRLGIENLKRDAELAKQKLNSVGKEAQKAGKTTKESFKDSGKSMLSLVAAIGGVIIAFQQLARQFSASIKATSDMIVANVKLNSILKLNGENVAKYSKQFNEYASKIQRTLGISDDVVKSSMALGLQLGIQADEMEEATTAAIALSETFGMDLDRATRIVAEAYNGNYDALKRYIPELRSANSEVEKAAIFQKYIAKAFKITQEAMDSQVGILKVAENQWGELQKIVGQFLLDVITPLASLFIKFVNWFKSLNSGLQTVIALV